MRCPGCGRFVKRSEMEVVDDGGLVCAKCRRAAAPRPYPYRAGGFIVLGPDVVMLPDRSRIRFEGEWYHPVMSHAPTGAAQREEPAPTFEAAPGLFE